MTRCDLLLFFVLLNKKTDPRLRVPAQNKDGIAATERTSQEEAETESL
jgi:hypothetical protein